MSTAKHESTPPVPTARRASSAFAVAPGAVAPVGRRVGAYALDALVAVLAAGIGYAVVAVSGPSAPGAVLALPVVLALVVGVGQWIAEARTGATVGSAITGIRTLSATTGRPAGLLSVLVRQLVVAAGTLACAVGQWVVVASGAWDRTPAQRGWHDKAAGTLVLLARPAARSSQGGAAAWNQAVARTVEPAPAGSYGVVDLVPVAPAAPLGPIPLAPVTSAAPVPMVRSVPDAPAADAAPVAPPALITSEPVAPTRAAVPLPPTVAVIEAPALDLTAELPVAPAAGLLAGPRPDLAGSPLVRPADDDLRELEHTRLRDAAPSVPAPARVRLRFDTGELVDVTGDGLVGRNPGAEPGTDHVLAIDDPERSISKVHLAFGLDDDGRLWVMDRASTNGTLVDSPDGRTAALVPGLRATVAPGSTVRFGRRSVQVTRH